MWSLESVGGEWVADNVLLSALLESLNELLVDALLYVDTGARATALAVVEEDSKVNPRYGVVDVGIVEDNVGALATKLECDLFEVGACRGFEDGSASDGGTGEGNFVDVHVRGNGSTGNFAKARNDIDDSWWETSLLYELCSVKT